jgi:hypothetical protein
MWNGLFRLMLQHASGNLRLLGRNLRNLARVLVFILGPQLLHTARFATRDGIAVGDESARTAGTRRGVDRFRFGVSNQSEDFMDVLLAYFDPGAGSLLLQALLGGVGGLIVAVRYFWIELTNRRGLHKSPIQLPPPPSSC